MFPIECVYDAISISWRVAHEAKTITTWLRAWNSVQSELKGIWLIALYGPLSVNDTKELREEIDFLREIAHRNQGAFNGLR